MKETSTGILNLHVSEGVVWRGISTDLSRNSKQCIAEFLDDGGLANAECVHLMGARVNAPLIVALFDQLRYGNLKDVRVGTPLMCLTAADRRDPEAVLFNLIGFSRAPSQGGFHSVNEDDYSVYALASATMSLTGAPLPVTEHVLRILKTHPAWRALSFIPHIDLVACVGLLSYVLDPRWFIDRYHPDRLNKLEAYLGLHPKTQAGVTIVGRARWRWHDQCALVRDCWKQPALESEVRRVFRTATPIPVDGSVCPGIAPGDFPWRVWGMRNGIGMSDTTACPVIADLRASQCFIAFLRHTWLDALYRTGSGLPEQGAGLFRPIDFFKHPSEIAAYTAHLLQFQAV